MSQRPDQHRWKLESGTAVTLVDRPGFPASAFGCDGEEVNAFFDDEGPVVAEDECSAGIPGLGGLLMPAQALSVFDVQSPSGAWEMTAADGAAGNTGTLEAWCLEVRTQMVFSDSLETGQLTP